MFLNTLIATTVIHYGAGGHQLYRMTKADIGLVKGEPTRTVELVENLIRKHMRKDTGTSSAGSRLSMEASDLASEAALVAMPLDSKEDRRAPRSYASLDSDDGLFEQTLAEHEAEFHRPASELRRDGFHREGKLGAVLVGRPISEGGVVVGRAVSTLAKALAGKFSKNDAHQLDLCWGND